MTRNRTHQPKYRERKGAPLGSLPPPYDCPMPGCDAGPYERLEGVGLHLRTCHALLGPRGRSVTLDGIRYPGAVA